MKFNLILIGLVFVVVIFSSGISLSAEEDPFKIVTTGTVQNDKDENLYEFTEEGATFEIENSNEETMVGIQDLEPGSTLRMDGKGNAQLFY